MRRHILLASSLIALVASAPRLHADSASREVTMFKDIPDEYLIEADEIPDFWVASVEDVNAFLDERIRKGTVVTVGKSAGGRPMRAVLYGEPRDGAGTTTFSGSLGFRDVRAYFGADHEKKVFMAMGAVHGGELEGIAGLVNLLSVLETGRDLRGTEWPEIEAAAEALDRIIIIPITNVDGRARIPLRRLPHTGMDKEISQYYNTGAWSDGSNIGWPTCKEFIPLDFSRTQFPGGYPNDAGVNIQHDDFLGPGRQPETQALLDLTARERPDVILNMHTGAPPKNYYTRVHRPFAESALTPMFDELYRRVHTGLTAAGLQSSDDASVEADPAQQRTSVYNLDTALNLHCGALAVLIEAPSHAFSGTDREGEVVLQTPDLIVDAQLVCHQEAMKFLVETGGRCEWTGRK